METTNCMYSDLDNLNNQLPTHIYETIDEISELIEKNGQATVKYDDETIEIYKNICFIENEIINKFQDSVEVEKFF